MSDRSNDKILRKQLAQALEGGESHVTFEKTLQDFPPGARTFKPEGAPHNAWELIEHMRIAQKDILEFSRSASHESPSFPEGYWPQTSTPPDDGAWDQTVRDFVADRKQLADLIEKGDLYQAFAWGDGQTLLREAILVANHNSYELGQVVFLKRMFEESGR